MNVVTFCLLIATFIWSIVVEHAVLGIFVTILAVYLGLSMYSQRRSLTSLNRKLQISAYNEPGDPSCFAKIPIDLEAADKFLAKYNAENPDEKLSYTTIALKAIGEGLSGSRKINGKLCFGNFVPL